jgi:hypothetical protein
MIYENKIKRLINGEILSFFRGNNKPAEPIGYNPLDKIRGALYHWVKVPFNNEWIWCNLKCLNGTQIESFGNFSNIIPKEKRGGELSHDDLINYRNFQEQVAGAVLNIPTYDHIMELVQKEDFVISDKKKELERIKNIDISILPIAQRIEIEKDIERLELFLGYILPTDTFDFLVFWAMGNDVTEVKKLSDEQLLHAALLADRGHDNPSDHLSGIFSDHNKDDINRAAWNLLSEYLDKKRIESSGSRVVGGPGKR